ncbi:MAG: alpha-amylase family glycosyl hydrolase [Candidatus Aenigmatarchaeota archaeon]
MEIKDLIIYHIFIDRFAGFDEEKDDSKPERIGGNLRGIIKKLPYLKKLGINCIWLSPFYKSASYHGYDITDFFKIDESVGDERDLENLLKKANKAGIYVIADLVPNHCSENHPFFIDARTNPKSKYKSWFYFKHWPDDYLSFLHFKHLPKMNLENKETSKYMLDVASYWLSKGLKGFRIDHAIGLPKEFLLELQKLAKAKDAFLLGEVWFFGIKLEHEETIKGVDLRKIFESKHASMEDVAIKELNILDSFLDFTFNSLIKAYLKGEMCSKEFYEKLENHYKFLEKTLPTFLDNHDMNRLIFELNNDKKLFKIASVLQFIMSQPPIIYYGDEIGLSQALKIEELPEHGDVQARRRMEWEEQDTDLLMHYQKLCDLRKKIDAMKIGRMRAFYCDYSTRLLAILKEARDRILAIFNPDNTFVIFNLHLDELNAKYLVDLFEDKRIDERHVRMNLEPKSFKLFLLK